MCDRWCCCTTRKCSDLMGVLCVTGGVAVRLENAVI